VIHHRKIWRRRKAEIILNERPKTYICNPIKNKDCKKNECYKNGGACHRTRHKEFELKVVNKKNK